MSETDDFHYHLKVRDTLNILAKDDMHLMAKNINGQITAIKKMEEGHLISLNDWEYSLAIPTSVQSAEVTDAIIASWMFQDPVLGHVFIKTVIHGTRIY